MRASDAVVRILQDLKTDVIFGVCGDTSLPLYEALHDHGSDIRYLLARDERSAAFMADAYARLSDRVGVCEGPSGGGATYILPGVAEADGSSVPMVCLTSDSDSRSAGRGVLTELDQRSVFSSVTRYSRVPARAELLPRTLRAAFTHASTGALGAAHIGLPSNVLTETVAAEDVYADPSFGRYPAFRVGPDIGAVARMASLLAQSKRPLVVAGAGVIRSGAEAELAALAETLGAPVATSISGKGSIAETSPYALGVVGSNGGLPYRHAYLNSADLVFFVGCSQGSVTTSKWTLPRDHDKTIVQMDVDATRIGRNYRTQAAVVADAKLGLAALVEHVGHLVGGEPRGHADLDVIHKGREAHMADVEGLFTSTDSPIRPERFLSELFRALPDDAIICADPGTPCPYLAAYLRLPKAGKWFVTPRKHGALGYSLPAVVGASLARPDCGRVLGIMGDGSFAMSAGELETIARLDLPVTLIVLNNASYGWIKAGQKASHGAKYYAVDLSDSDHARIAQAYGIRGIRAEDPEELAQALIDGLTHPGPVLIDVLTQPLQEARAPVSAWAV